MSTHMKIKSAGIRFSFFKAGSRLFSLHKFAGEANLKLFYARRAAAAAAAAEGEQKCWPPKFLNWKFIHRACCVWQPSLLHRFFTFVKKFALPCFIFPLLVDYKFIRIACCAECQLYTRSPNDEQPWMSRKMYFPNLWFWKRNILHKGFRHNLVTVCFHTIVHFYRIVPNCLIIS